MRHPFSFTLAAKYSVMWVSFKLFYRHGITNNSIYSMAYNKHLSEAANAAIMPCQSKLKSKSRRPII